MQTANSAFLRPRIAFRSRAAQSGISTYANRIESNMNFDIDGGSLAQSEARGRVQRNASLVVGRRLSILFVTPFLPSPPRFGAQRRLHELMAGLAASSDVSVLSLVDPGENHDEAILATEKYCRRVVTVSNPSGRIRKRLLQLGSLASAHSHDWLGHREDSFRTALVQMLAHRFDVVQFELAPMAGYAAACGRDPLTRPVLCLDEHNIEYDIVRRTAGAEAGALRRAYSAIEWRKVRREERRAWGHLDGCTLTSGRDQQMLLADEPTARTAVVPNGVDVDFFHPSPRSAPRERRTLLFFGAIDYYPNTDAMLFFLRDVLPGLVARDPHLRLCIVGRRPPESILAQRSANVEVVGVVDDVRPWIERADVVVVPLRIGGGTRLKVLEAMAMGKAVVSTSLGVEGLEVVADRDVLIADDAATFAAQIARMLEDPEGAQRIGASARRLVASRYSWKAAVAGLSKFYVDLIQSRAAAQ
jgi:glycosyltransferase involved in cell wall biosynthesis